MIWTIIVIALAAIVALFAYSVARSAADGDRRMAEEHKSLLPEPRWCVVCGEDTIYADAKDDAYCERHLDHPSIERDVA